jgi:DNA adenine methylase
MIPRYPGGKKNLHGKILRHFPNPLWCGDMIYTEPFIGGGGLLSAIDGFKELNINDLDVGVIAVYKMIKSDVETLIQDLLKVVPSVERWEESKKKDGIGEIREAALNKIILHSCSHGGMGYMSGPQGGYDQSGSYKIDCRWKPRKWSNSLRELANKSHNWDVTSKDFQELDTVGFCYADPPYVKAGSGLYKNSFKESDHLRLRNWVANFDSFVVSYDDNELIRDLYSGFDIEEIEVNSVNSKNKKQKELVIWKNK